MKNTITYAFRQQPLFVFLLLIFFVFHGYVENYPIVPLREASYLLLIYFGCAIGIIMLSWLWYRDLIKASLFCFIILSFQFFFGALYDLLHQHRLTAILGKYSVLVPVLLIILIITAIFLKRRRRGLGQATYYLNVVLLVLIVVDLGMLMTRPGGGNKLSYTVNKQLKDCIDCPKPDIYLVLADGYAGKQELNDLFHYDNSGFEDALKQRGFHLVDSPHSNYPFTIFSVSSMLQMQFLPGLNGSNSDKKDVGICLENFKKNEFTAYLTAQGYTFYNYSIFDVGRQPSVVENTLLPVKAKLITSQTFTSRIIRDMGYHLVTTLKMPSMIRKIKYGEKRNNDKLYEATLKTAREQTGQPKFVYTHLLMPHYPYYFDSLGHELPISKLEDSYYKDRDLYLSYLKYANGQYLRLIDHILKNSRNPPVIFFLSDHGFREFSEKVEEKYHYMNLEAILLPSKDYSPYYKGLTPVNLLRIFLNQEFRQQLKMLPDSVISIRE